MRHNQLGSRRYNRVDEFLFAYASDIIGLISSRCLYRILMLCHQNVGLTLNSQCDPLEFIQRILVDLSRSCGRNTMQITIRNVFICQTRIKSISTSDC